MTIIVSIILVVLLSADIYFRNKKFHIERDSTQEAVSNNNYITTVSNTFMQKISAYEETIRKQNKDLEILNARLQKKNDIVASRIHRKNLFSAVILESLVKLYGNVNDFEDWEKYIDETSDKLINYLEQSENENTRESESD